MIPRKLRRREPLQPFDERDSVFARARLEPGDPRAEDYYARHPERRAGDERTRRQPDLASPGGQRFRPGEAALVEGSFAASDLVAAAVERAAAEQDPAAAEGISTRGRRQPYRLEDESPAALTRYLLDAARFLGADDAGVARAHPAQFYSHRGRPLERFGDVVDPGHRSILVMAFAMRPEYVGAGPEMISTAETARVYQVAAAACYSMAEALRRLGHGARAHVDSNYLAVAPHAAVDAGLGELGRQGFLIHRRLGPGVRLGMVSLDTELEYAEEGSWGISEFCRTCEKCAKRCPAGAIPRGEPVFVRGSEKWPLNAERCYHYWRTQGTDCGVCIRVCPFAKKDSFLHKSVRAVIARTDLFNRLFLRLDDLFYGSSSQPRRVPRIG